MSKHRKKRGGIVSELAKLVTLERNMQVKIKLCAANFPGRTGRVHEILPDEHGQRRIKVRFVLGARVVFVTYSMCEISTNHPHMQWEGNAALKDEEKNRDDKRRQCLVAGVTSTLVDVLHWRINS